MRFITSNEFYNSNIIAIILNKIIKKVGKIMTITLLTNKKDQKLVNIFMVSFLNV